MNVNFDKKKIIRMIALIMALIWMAVIFYFSSQPSEESSETSMGTSYCLVVVADKLFGLNMKVAQMFQMAEGIEKTVRKIAHMMEYAMLSALWSIVLDVKEDLKRVFGRLAELKDQSNGRIKTFFINRWWLTFLICILYAASDEIHQIFVPGRYAMFKDVAIDSGGGLIVLIIIALAGYGKYRRTAVKG